ncbi:MAG: hypothetical protein DRO39_04265 [Thermoprotei archaeon]|nr:MAG: hypothetical protein DRO39_04265 [Thermoprotei archaeon]
MSKLVALGLALIILGLITILPAPASKPNRLGFTSVCSFSPYSTIVLLIPGVAVALAGLAKRRRREVVEGA